MIAVAGLLVHLDAATHVIFLIVRQEYAAAPDSPARKNIRFIFNEEEAWGFRPTPYMWARSPIR